MSQLSSDRCVWAAKSISMDNDILRGMSVVIKD
jgi:hypothetical protein